MMDIGSMLHNIDMISLSKLGQGKACDRRRELEQYLGRISQSTQKHYIDMITDLYILEDKIRSGYCAFLLSWYINQI